MLPDALDAAIADDRANGLLPAGIIACVGGTSVGGTDDIAAVAARRQRSTGSICMSMPPGPARR